MTLGYAIQYNKNIFHFFVDTEQVKEDERTGERVREEK